MQRGDGGKKLRRFCRIIKVGALYAGPGRYYFRNTLRLRAAAGTASGGKQFRIVISLPELPMIPCQFIISAAVKENTGKFLALCQGGGVNIFLSQGTVIGISQDSRVTKKKAIEISEKLLQACLPCFERFRLLSFYDTAILVNISHCPPA